MKYLFFSIIPLANSSYADFCSYIDENGVHHYTNTPPTDKRYNLKWRTKKASVKPNGIHTYLKSYEEEILRAAKRHNLGPDLVKAVIKL